MLDATLRRIKQGQIDGIEAIDDLLAEELTLAATLRSIVVDHKQKRINDLLPWDYPAEVLSAQLLRTTKVLYQVGEVPVLEQGTASLPQQAPSTSPPHAHLVAMRKAFLPERSHRRLYRPARQREGRSRA